MRCSLSYYTQPTILFFVSFWPLKAFDFVIPGSDCIQVGNLQIHGLVHEFNWTLIPEIQYQSSVSGLTSLLQVHPHWLLYANTMTHHFLLSPCLRASSSGVKSRLRPLAVFPSASGFEGLCRQSMPWMSLAKCPFLRLFLSGEDPPTVTPLPQINFFLVTVAFWLYKALLKIGFQSSFFLDPHAL